MKSFIKKNKFIILSVVVFFLFSLLFPYTGDDLGWSQFDLSIESLKSVFTSPSVNGRYLGNLLVIIMTNNIFVRGIIESLIIGGIIYLIKKETGVHISLVWLFLAALPVVVLAQGVVWTSGFTNYVTSTLLLLLCLVSLRDCYKNPGSKSSCLKNAFLFFASSLFIENVTVFLLIFTIVLNIIYFIKNKKINYSLLWAGIGSFIGTALMFIQPAYHNVLTGEDPYRSYGKGIGGLIMRCCANFIVMMQKYVVFENVWLLGFLTILLCIYYKNNKDKVSFKESQIAGLALGFQIVFIIYCLLSKINLEWQLARNYTIFINAILVVLYLLTFITTLVILFRKNKNFVKILMPIIVIVGLLAPLLVVTPIGPRNFFMVYVLEMIEVFYILNETHFDYKKFLPCIYMILFVVGVYYVSIYGQVRIASIRRDNYVKYISQNASDTLVNVPYLPYLNYTHFANYEDEYWTSAYKTFLGVRNDLTFSYTDYDTWKKYVKEEDQ